MSREVYIVEVGAYSDRYISAIFEKREDAERYVIETARRSWRSYTNGPEFPDPDGKSFEEWRKETERLIGNWNNFGDVEAYEVLDSVPVIEG